MVDEVDGREENHEPEKKPRVKKYAHTLSEYAPGPEKSSLEEIVLGIQHKELHSIFGVEPEHSFLFYGPPGAGKTFGVHAVRNELEKRGIKTEYFEYSIGLYGTAYINMGAVTMNDFFKSVKKRSAHTDVVILNFDECEAIMGHRGGTKTHNEDDKLLNTLMTNLQLISDQGLPIYCFFCTNFFEGLDPAAIRAGRIHRRVSFKLPDINGLLSAYELEKKLANKKGMYEVVRVQDFKKIAEESLGLSLADVHEIVSGSVRKVLLEELRKDKMSKAGHVTEELLYEQLLKYKKEFIGHEKPKIGF